MKSNIIFTILRHFGYVVTTALFLGAALVFCPLDAGAKSFIVNTDYETAWRGTMEYLSNTTQCVQHSDKERGEIILGPFMFSLCLNGEDNVFKYYYAEDCPHGVKKLSYVVSEWKISIKRINASKQEIDIILPDKGDIIVIDKGGKRKMACKSRSTGRFEREVEHCILYIIKSYTPEAIDFSNYDGENH